LSWVGTAVKEADIDGARNWRADLDLSSEGADVDHDHYGRAMKRDRLERGLGLTARAATAERPGVRQQSRPRRPQDGE
jgi:hypothetical protein